MPTPTLFYLALQARSPALVTALQKDLGPIPDRIRQVLKNSTTPALTYGQLRYLLGRQRPGQSELTQAFLRLLLRSDEVRAWAEKKGITTDLLQELLHKDIQMATGQTAAAAIVQGSKDGQLLNTAAMAAASDHVMHKVSEVSQTLPRGDRQAMEQRYSPVQQHLDKQAARTAQTRGKKHKASQAAAQKKEATQGQIQKLNNDDLLLQAAHGAHNKG